MSPKQITIAGTRIAVPVDIHPEDAQRLAAQVTERIKEIEAESPVIDTHSFALQAALSFASEIDDRQHEQKDDTKDILVSLDALSDRLEGLLREYSLDQSPD